MLAIEIDGGSHQNKNYLDTQRDLLLEKYRIKTVRLSDKQVINELDKIKSDLKKIIQEREKLIFSSPLACPSGRRVKGESPDTSRGRRF